MLKALKTFSKLTLTFGVLFFPNSFLFILAESAGAAEEYPPPAHNECPGDDIKKPDSEPPVMLELYGIRSTPWLPSLPDPLWPGMVAPERVRAIDQIELFDI